MVGEARFELAKSRLMRPDTAPWMLPRTPALTPYAEGQALDQYSTVNIGCHTHDVPFQ